MSTLYKRVIRSGHRAVKKGSAYQDSQKAVEAIVAPLSQE
jgi:hypothetical protein